MPTVPQQDSKDQGLSEVDQQKAEKAQQPGSGQNNSQGREPEGGNAKKDDGTEEVRRRRATRK